MELDAAIAGPLTSGVVIPAHPLALAPNRRLDERRQRALTRYYLDSGAGGLAVGVHTTQFEIHEQNVRLLEPVLRMVAEEIDAWSPDPVIKVAGLIGPAEQTVREAELAVRCGYHLGLLSPAAGAGATEEELLDRARAVAEVIPVFGFYLQPAVGGRDLSYRFWRSFFDLDGVYACKVACFDRYRTIDVIRAASDSDRRDQLALYTGNDDAIAADLLTPFPNGASAGAAPPRYFAGGVLGQWAVWTRTAVELLGRAKHARFTGEGHSELLALGAELTDANGAIFDHANGFRGCIPGIHEILRRQGLLAGRWCLRPDLDLSPGQSEEISRVCTTYPSLADDDFVRANLGRWLS